MSARRGKQVSSAEFRALWCDLSLTCTEIGARLGITQAAVSARAQMRDLPPRPYGPVPLISNNAGFAKMWAAGVHGREMAKAFGVSEKTVRNHAKRLKLPKRTGGQGHGITAAQYAEQVIAAGMRAESSAVRAQWALAEMVDRKAYSSGKRAA